jgi:hypothetical protein
MTTASAENVSKGAPECAEYFEEVPSKNLRTEFLPSLKVAAEYRKALENV